MIGSPGLRGFGLDIPIWPLSAIAFFALAGAQLALLADHRAAAVALLAIPLLIGVAGVIQSLTGYDGGLHSLLFGEQLALVRATTPGRTPYMVMLDWMLIMAAMLLAGRQNGRAGLVGYILASIPLALSIMTIGLTTAGVPIAGSSAEFLWASRPASYATILLCLSIFFWCRVAGSKGTAREDDAASWAFVRLVPLVLLLPSLYWLLLFVGLSAGMDHRSIDATAVSLGVVLIGGILAWAMHRMSRQQALIHAILDTVPDAVIACDGDGKIRRFSAGAANMFGYEPEKMVGKHFTLLAAESQRGLAEASFQRYLETGVSENLGYVRRVMVVGSDGVEMPAEQRVVETMAGGERIFIWFLRDLTETMANEEYLGRLAAELGHVARLSAMGEMAAGMAHELNQPLTAITNYTGAAGILMEQGDVDRARELLERANTQALRAGQTIRRMREFTSKGQVEMDVVSVEDMIRDAVALVFVGHMPAGIALSHALDPRVSTIAVDRIQIQQVLVNLLRNAVQAMQRGESPIKTIQISTSLQDDDMLEIVVSDTGPGISEAVRATLFAPFTASSNKGGMGIGLSICRRIVGAHGGKISATNKKGGGAEFRFTVPVSQGLRDAEGENANDIYR